MGRSERQSAEGRQGRAAFSGRHAGKMGKWMDCAWWGLDIVKRFDSEVSLANELTKKTRT
jgi:hypothetical protein